MKREDYAGIPAFLAVAEEHSFTRAAAKLGVSQSALSQTVRRLEERLDLHLLARTTRSVSLTEAGECLVQRIGPHLEEIGNELSAMAGERNTATGTVRITTGEHAATTVLWPRLKPFLAAHPGITLEINTAQSLTDIVAERYDAGVRFGE
jgi:DNA-binding transcriptional LysR family regulator